MAPPRRRARDGSYRSVVTRQDPCAPRQQTLDDSAAAASARQLPLTSSASAGGRKRSMNATCSTVHYNTQYMTRHCSTLRYIKLHCIVFHSIPLHVDDDRARFARAGRPIATGRHDVLTRHAGPPRNHTLRHSTGARTKKTKKKTRETRMKRNKEKAQRAAHVDDEVLDGRKGRRKRGQEERSTARGARR